jgi:hypothetical protein
LTPYINQDRAILWTAILASDKGSLILYLLSPKCTREKALVSGQQMSFPFQLYSLRRFASSVLPRGLVLCDQSECVYPCTSKPLRMTC